MKIQISPQISISMCRWYRLKIIPLLHVSIHEFEPKYCHFIVSDQTDPCKHESPNICIIISCCIFWLRYPPINRTKNSTTSVTLVHYQPAWPPKGVLYIALQKSWDRCESIWPICFYLLILFFTPIARGSLHKSLCQIGLLFNTIFDIGILIQRSCGAKLLKK